MPFNICKVPESRPFRLFIYHYGIIHDGVGFDGSPKQNLDYNRLEYGRSIISFVANNLFIIFNLYGNSYFL